MRGRVKWFNNEKGYGFIEQENDEDIFIHYSQIEKEGYKTLKDGDYVQFEVVKAEKGLHAEHIKRIEELQTIE